MIRVAMCGAMALIAASAAAQCPSEGDCRKPHATPGCVMPDCCVLVCDANPLCCEITWDQACADLAIELCDGINCPADGPCTAAHPTPGCQDYACCDFVSSIDGWCSWASWDELCVRIAVEACGAPPCGVVTAGAVSEAEPCYDRLNDGCGIGIASGRIAPECGIAMTGRITTGGPRDLDWFALDGAVRRRYRVSLEAEFPVELQYFRGDCEGPNDVKWLMARAVCGGAIAFSFIADAGVSSLILGTGTADEPLRNGIDCDEVDPDNPPPPDAPPPEQLFGTDWVLRLDCLALGDINGDGTVGAQDIAALLNAWGPVPGGEVDPTAADADLDGDGSVGATDITILLGSW
ncbi:MAG: hypothetical protein RL325_1337 [Planctomycetota bacterium]